MSNSVLTRQPEHGHLPRQTHRRRHRHGSGEHRFLGGHRAWPSANRRRCYAPWPASAERGEIDRVKMYYFHAETPMAQTVLHYELMGRLLPYSMFLQRPERELIKRGEQRRSQGGLFHPDLV